MRSSRLLWRLYAQYLLITLAVLTAVGWVSARAIRDFHLAQTTRDLEVRAQLIEARLTGLIARDTAEPLTRLCRSLGQRTGTRITVILPSGDVIADSDEDPTRMSNHAERPEVREAIAGRAGSSTRFSHTLGHAHRYVAVPVQATDGTRAVLRASVPMTAQKEALDTIYTEIALGGLMIAVLAAGLALLFVRRITRPLEQMKRGAERFAGGDFSQRLSISDNTEIGALAHTLNQMAEQLEERIRTIMRQQQQEKAVLTSMAGAALAVDSEEKLIVFNMAAERLLGAERDKVLGRHLLEAVRNLDIRKFLTDTLERQEPHQGEIVLMMEDEPRYLQASGSVLRDADERAIGALVVLNDVTRIRKLELLRKEFVANVSHELKTPITSIQGAAETLTGGAVEDPEAAQRFLAIIARHTKRLNAIIDDLLQLARIEQDDERGEIVTGPRPLAEVLRSAVETCAERAAKRRIAIALECDEGLRVIVEPRLLEQAVVNLLDNAVSYSDEGGPVRVEASAGSGEARIAVVDQGCGIPAKHHARLFERFYRVDKARSRELGGTGLGLAIVKHIAEAHGGRISVQSAPGQGSSFTIHLPLA